MNENYLRKPQQDMLLKNLALAPARIISTT